MQHVYGWGGRGGGERRIRIWWESQNERDHCEEPDLNGKIILKWILEN
jgi:hypothetical protein